MEYIHGICVCCGVLQCVAVCCSVLQCVAVCCSVLQCVAAYNRGMRHALYIYHDVVYEDVYMPLLQGSFGKRDL